MSYGYIISLDCLPIKPFFPRTTCLQFIVKIEIEDETHVSDLFGFLLIAIGVHYSYVMITFPKIKDS